MGDIFAQKAAFHVLPYFIPPTHLSSLHPFAPECRFATFPPNSAPRFFAVSRLSRVSSHHSSDLDRRVPSTHTRNSTECSINSPNNKFKNLSTNGWYCCVSTFSEWRYEACENLMRSERTEPARRRTSRVVSLNAATPGNTGPTRFPGATRSIVRVQVQHHARAIGALCVASAHALSEDYQDGGRMLGRKWVVYWRNAG